MKIAGIHVTQQQQQVAHQKMDLITVPVRVTTLIRPTAAPECVLVRSLCVYVSANFFLYHIITF